MTDEFEKRAREAAEKPVREFGIDGNAEYEQGFVHGAKWARAEMQAEIDHANDIATRMRKAMETEGYPKLCEDAIARIDQAETEIERLKNIESCLDRKFKEDQLEIEQLKGELEQANKQFLDEEELMHKWQKKADDLSLELEQAKGEHDSLKSIHTDICEATVRWSERYKKLKAELDECVGEKSGAVMALKGIENRHHQLELLAESYRQALEYYAHPDHYEERITMAEVRPPGVIADGGHKARQALEDGK